jgi:hypothetical protein
VQFAGLQLDQFPPVSFENWNSAEETRRPEGQSLAFTEQLTVRERDQPAGENPVQLPGGTASMVELPAGS